MGVLFEQARVKSKLRVSEVSAKTHIKEERLLEIENGKTEPDIYEIMVLGELYNSFELILHGRNKKVSLGTIVNSYRRGIGLTASELAKRVGTSARTLYRIEADERKLDIELCSKIQKELDINSFIFNKGIQECKQKHGEKTSSQKKEYLSSYNKLMSLYGQQTIKGIKDNEYKVLKQFLSLKTIQSILESFNSDKMYKCS